MMKYRTTDKAGRTPRHGEMAAYARAVGLDRVAVKARLRRGTFHVGADGLIYPRPSATEQPPTPKPTPAPEPSWEAKCSGFQTLAERMIDDRLEGKSPEDAAGDLNCQVRLALGSVLRGSVYVEQGHDVDGSPADHVNPAPFHVAAPPLELRPTLPIDPVIGAHRAGWERHVNAWLEKAVDMANHRPASWALTRVDALKYLRGRLNVLVDLAEQDAAAHPPTPEQEVERVAAAIRIGEKMKAGAVS